MKTSYPSMLHHSTPPVSNCDDMRHFTFVRNTKLPLNTFPRPHRWSVTWVGVILLAFGLALLLSAWRTA